MNLSNRKNEKPIELLTLNQFFIFLFSNHYFTLPKEEIAFHCSHEGLGFSLA